MASAVRKCCGDTRILVKSSSVLHNCYPKVSFHSSRKVSSSYWYKIYNERKRQMEDVPLPTYESTNKNQVFVNNEINLSDISVYGFDYDYTLAQYTDHLHPIIYDLGKQALITNNKYPKGIGDQSFDPNFILRGLHYDIRKGLLMKIDSFHHIQLGTVYRGTQQVSDVEVLELYNGTHVPLSEMNTFYGTTGSMYQLVDMFAPPEMNLITNVTDYFIKNNIPFDPEYVFHDVKNAVQGIHQSGLLHKTIMEDLERYLEKGPETKKLLEGLSNNGKRLFIITNSGFPFIDAGMRYMVGPDWQQLMDIVVVNARKPKFFNEKSRPFRLYDMATETTEWGRVKSLDKGRVYTQGNFKDFRHLTGWYGPKVLYFGDHVYSDLADPSLKHSWRTGAIIPELEVEIEVTTREDYKRSVRWLMALQHLIEEMQTYGSEESLEMIPELLKEREELRSHLKGMCNPRFGSMFRTHHNPTYFSRRMARFADIYTSKLTNLLQYSASHTFYPRRSFLPHEPRLFDDPTFRSVEP